MAYTTQGALQQPRNTDLTMQAARSKGYSHAHMHYYTHAPLLPNTHKGRLSICKLKSCAAKGLAQMFVTVPLCRPRQKMGAEE